MKYNIGSKLKSMYRPNYWQERITGEITFLSEALESRKQDIPGELYDSVDRIEKEISENGCVTKNVALEIEKDLEKYAHFSKEYTVICAAHAHIDMNWEWGIEETVGATIDTFQTMLNLLKEYPEFHFSQSQAATYNIIEKYCPSMLDEIRKYISEGRWEVTASTWVENDKNMAGTEAQIRQILYTKRYLSKLLNISPATLDIDFEPDTFGHNINLAEISNIAGIRYLYHCRGYDGKNAYVYKAPSGAELLSYNEPNWYLGPIEYDRFNYVPEFCSANYTNTALVVYGVGDHGGGPSRRDIERILDMRQWPLMPEIRFGKVREFFEELEKCREKLPVITKELNCVFTGCYTSQSRIKQANRYSEDRLYDSEALSVMAKKVGNSALNFKGFEEAWRRILFNQFHDILPGSGVRETRDYAMATAAEACSYALGNANRAIKAIGDAVDTSLFGTDGCTDSTAEGAGPGFGATKSSLRERLWQGSEYNITNVGRSGGPVRPYTLFNTTQYERNEVVDITLWDWKYPLHETAVMDASGKEITMEIIEDRKPYWSHESVRLAFCASVPPFGYSNYYIVHKDYRKKTEEGSEPRVHRMEDGLMELKNDKISAKFESHTMKLVSLVNLETGEEFIPHGDPAACMYLIDESEVRPYNAWTIGNFGRIELINDTCFVDVKEQRFEKTRQWIDYSISFRNSKVSVRVSLGEHDSHLRFSFEVDWNDKAIPEVSTPHLRFRVPYTYSAEKIRYAVPGGYLDREKVGYDVPATFFAAPVNENGSCLFITSDCKYGYRANDNYVDVNMLRSSYLPDLYPEVGVHRYEIGVGLSKSGEWSELRKEAFCFSHPVYSYSNTVHSGVLPPSAQLVNVGGNAAVASLKLCEDDPSAYLVRFVADSCKSSEISVYDDSARKVEEVDANETVIGSLHTTDGLLKKEIAKGTIKTVKIS